jgi:hypothetical protein
VLTLLVRFAGALPALAGHELTVQPAGTWFIAPTLTMGAPLSTPSRSRYFDSLEVQVARRCMKLFLAVRQFLVASPLTFADFFAI